MKTIRRYKNRKLYDTDRAVYITLADVAQFVLDDVAFVVLDQKTREDLTAKTLTQAIFEGTRRFNVIATTDSLRQIIQRGTLV